MSGPMVLLVDGTEGDGEIPVSPTSPLWRLGQSLFETMLVHPSGGIFRLKAHLARLLGSAENLGWSGCPATDQLARWIARAVSLFGATEGQYGRLRVTVAWTSSDGPPVTTVAVVPYARRTEPLHVMCTSVRVPKMGELATPKAGSRTAYSYAETLAAHAGADEALLVDEGGRPIEGAKSNLFVVSDGFLYTAPVASGVLPGITRDVVLSLAQSDGWEVEWKPLPPEALYRCEAVFLTNALWGMRPVAEVDGRHKDPQQFDALRSVAVAYEEAVKRELHAMRQGTGNP